MISDKFQQEEAVHWKKDYTERVHSKETQWDNENK